MHITHNSVTYFLYGDVSGAPMWLLVAPHIIACPLQSRKCGYAPAFKPDHYLKFAGEIPSVTSSIRSLTDILKLKFNYRRRLRVH